MSFPRYGKEFIIDVSEEGIAYSCVVLLYFPNRLMNALDIQLIEVRIPEGFI